MSNRLERLRLQIVAGESAALIGGRIRDARKAKGWSRRELARQMDGVSTENDIYRWERGQHRPRDDALAAAARALSMPVSYFVDDSPRDTPELFPAAEPPDFADLVRRLDAIEELIASVASSNAARVAEVMQLLEDRLPPSEESQHRRPA